MAQHDIKSVDYVLGWMNTRQRSRMNRRIEADPAIRAGVEGWHASLAPLARLCEPVAPPQDAWAGVLAKLNATPAANRPGRGWKWAVSGAALGTALAAVLILVQPRTLYRAELTPDATAQYPFVTVEADSVNDVILKTIALPSIGPDKSLELWIIPAGGQPRSLGVITGRHYRRHLDALAPGDALAISLEPAGGSPTGAPTGKVIVSGALKRL